MHITQRIETIRRELTGLTGFHQLKKEHIHQFMLDMITKKYTREEMRDYMMKEISEINTPPNILKLLFQ